MARKRKGRDVSGWLCIDKAVGQTSTATVGSVKRLFGDAMGNVSMSSTKSAIGHLLGGAGAVETIFCILAIRDQVVPPTLNLDNPDEGTEGADLVPKVAKKRRRVGSSPSLSTVSVSSSPSRRLAAAAAWPFVSSQVTRAVRCRRAAAWLAAR